MSTKKTTVYRCTECDSVFDDFDAAAQCHWGIGGVVDVADDERRDRPVTL